MIELIDNLIQLVLTATCTLVAFYRAFRFRRQSEMASKRVSKIPTINFQIGRREWILLGLCTGEYFFGDLFTVLYLALYDETPPYLYISNISWYTSYLFLSLLVLYVSDRQSIRMQSRAQLLIPIFTITMCVVFFIDDGGIFDNLLGLIVMTPAIWLAGGALEIERQQKKKTGHRSKKWYFFLLCLVIPALEYGLWVTSGFFWIGDTILNPYFCIDLALSVCFVLLMFTADDAIKASNIGITEVDG